MLYSWALICGYRIWFQFHKYFFPCWFYFVFFLNVESGALWVGFWEMPSVSTLSGWNRSPGFHGASATNGLLFSHQASMNLDQICSHFLLYFTVFPYPQSFVNILHSSNNIKKIPCFSKKLFPHWWEIWVMVFESRNIFTWW